MRYSSSRTQLRYFRNRQGGADVCGTFFTKRRFLTERMTLMALLLFSMAMFFAMIFATLNGLRKETRFSRPASRFSVIAK